VISPGGAEPIVEQAGTEPVRHDARPFFAGFMTPQHQSRGLLGLRQLVGLSDNAAGTVRMPRRRARCPGASGENDAPSIR
jgi:hypothetical protein